MRANFFERPAPILPRTELNLPTFGEVVLEKMDLAKAMKFRALSQEKFNQYQINLFPPIGDKIVDITLEWAESAAALAVMQLQDEPYSFEELIAASVTDEEEYNELALAANTLNSKVDELPKAETSAAQSSDIPELA
jgi:hypothetical protein